MKIAIVAPSGVPFAIGGAENLWWGLLTHINQDTKHQAELIKIPSPERDIFEVVDSYRRFFRLDLDHFDMVISTKYPAWMVDHPYHVCYLQHTLRGLYDAYPLATIVADYSHPALTELHNILGSPADEKGLERLFSAMDRLRTNTRLGSYLAFPGPLARTIVHWLDAFGLSPTRIRRYLAISRTVAQREDYFPKNVPIEVVHHPSNLTGLVSREHTSIFTVSRLDPPKRIDLLIKAYKKTHVDLPLLIAGTGPDRNRLQELAGDDERIRFLGFVSDEAIVEHYARALFVPYLPCNEDYGLITVEAMGASKAVLTTTDAGGVNELVCHGRNGMCVDPDEDALAQAITTLVGDPEGTMRMGEEGFKTVADISWSATIDALLQPDENGFCNSPSRPRRKKVVVATTFPVFAPVSGGQRRIYHLYRELARIADVTIVSLCNHGHPQRTLNLASGYTEIQVPKTSAFARAEADLEAVVDMSVGDIVAINGYAQNASFVQILEAETQEADLLVASHPYLFNAFVQANLPVWYDAHNVEYDLKASMLESDAASDKLLKMVREVEEACVQASEMVLACSDQDLQRFGVLYDLPRERTRIVPNGVDVRTIAFTPIRKRRERKKKLGFSDTITLCLFVGSGHRPNEEGLAHILDMARELKKVVFLVVGTVCHAPCLKEPPANVKPLGVISETEKTVLLQSVDLGINPIVSGSGTNLKLLEYAAAGIPVLSTSFGARGTGLGEDELFVARPGEFCHAFERFRQTPEDEIDARVRRARAAMERGFSWQSIGERLQTLFTARFLS